MTKKPYKNCMDCPNHHVIRDDDPDDWFCDDDQAIVCTKQTNPEPNPESRHLSDRSEHRVVQRAIRPYNLHKEGASPSWCPLKAEENQPAEELSPT